MKVRADLKKLIGSQLLKIKKTWGRNFKIYAGHTCNIQDHELEEFDDIKK